MPIMVENLTVSYQKYPAVHHLNCLFRDGIASAICGPNGAGKSTLLKTIVGLLHTDTGKVIWQNLARKDIAYLPQQSEIDRSLPMNVFELTAMGLWFEIGCFGRLSVQQEKRIKMALDQVGMADFFVRPISSLSNGQFQRVLFARMLVQDAKFLLLDEPFNAVDAKTTTDLIALLMHAQKQGKAIVAVLHDYEQIRTYFTHTLLLAREKVAEGKTQEVLTEENLRLAAERMSHWQEHTGWCEVG